MSTATMEPERERQERDLQRATMLLETMPREELVDMLQDILFNERSDDTRKLSDWMAYQIIIQDETHAARKLLAQLGKDGRNHHRIEIAKSLSATGRSLATSNQDIKRQDDEPGEDSSSATSVVTCPDGEFPRHTQAQGTSNIGSSRTADASTEEAYKGRGSFAEAKESQPGNGKSVDIQDMPPSTSDSKTPDHGKNRRVSWLQWWRHTIFRRTHQASSDSSNNNKVPSETGPLLDLDSSSPQATDCPNDPSPAARARASNKTRKADRTTKALKTTNELGHKNLAELYARFDEAYVEELQVDLSEVDARKVRDQDLAHSTSTQSSNQAFEDMKKMQCQFCELYFTPEENVRDLDNGSSPCSHHPGKT